MIKNLLHIKIKSLEKSEDHSTKKVKEKWKRKQIKKKKIMIVIENQSINEHGKNPLLKMKCQFIPF